MTEAAADRRSIRFFSPGTVVLAVFAAAGLAFGLARLLLGLGAVTNLDNASPWGIWIAIDVACGVALASGGFTTAALVEIFGRSRYRHFLRPALLTAWLGYLMAVIGLIFDLGRYWNAWRPLLYWQGRSVLFEVGLCEIFGLAVLTVEMSPAILGRWRTRRMEKPGTSRWARREDGAIDALRSGVRITLPFFILAGVVLSCLHQSALGKLLLIAPSKIDPLWFTPLLPILFLLSAIMVGLPMIIIESILSARSFRRPRELDRLAGLAAIAPWTIGAYALVKAGDWLIRRPRLDLSSRPAAGAAFAVEIVLGIILPFVLFSRRSIRRSPPRLLIASFFVVFGVVLNRIDAYLIGYFPPFGTKRYYPAVGEISLTLGLAATLVLLYRFFALRFPIFDASADGAENKPAAAGRARKWALAGTAVLMAALVAAAIFGRVRAAGQTRAFSSFPSPAASLIPKRSAGGLRDDRANQEKPVYRTEELLNNPLLNSAGDEYEPVRFLHASHADKAGGDCAICHHRVASNSTDRVGEDVRKMHETAGNRIASAACADCHDDPKALNLRGCAKCHAGANEPDFPARIGLRGAYHRQCIGCHAGLPEKAKAPTACDGCHRPRLRPDR